MTFVMTAGVMGQGLAFPIFKTLVWGDQGTCPECRDTLAGGLDGGVPIAPAVPGAWPPVSHGRGWSMGAQEGTDVAHR